MALRIIYAHDYYIKNEGAYYPIDNYDYDTDFRKIITQYCEYADEYHVIKIPLLGQYNGKWGGDWCGRTAMSMLYNYYQLVEGGDVKSRYIKHWYGGHQNDNWIMDLRLPDTSRAFHTKPTDLPGQNLSGYKVRGAITDNPFKYSEDILFKSTTENRLDEAKKSLQANNPVVFYSGLSKAIIKDGKLKPPIHIILITGYFIFKKELWLLLADPETDMTGRWKQEQPILNHCKIEDLRNSQTEGKDTILLFDENWTFWPNARGTLRLFKASRFFELHPKSGDFFQIPGKRLLMDYYDSPGGVYFYSLTKKQTSTGMDVPSELILSSSSITATFPLASKISFESPLKYYHSNEMNLQAVGGYYGLGLNRNVHGGIHLCPDEKKRTAVRCTAAGYVVAARLPAKDTDADSNGNEFGETGLEIMQIVKNGLFIWLFYILLILLSPINCTFYLICKKVI
jgi:hypothetical protein